jgi:Ca2+-binding EF-hand superfamily protein
MKQIITLIAAGFLLLILPESLTSGQEKIESFLRKIDADRDGRVDTSEMTPPIARYLRSKGFDTNRSVKISSVVRVVAKSKAAKATESTSKVPSFGVDSDKPKANGVSSFGITPTIEYSEELKKRASDLMKKYDRNRNNVLDADEIRRIPWGNPKPAQNDKNGDGRLSLLEIQSRYYEREVAERNSRSKPVSPKVVNVPGRSTPTAFRGSAAKVSTAAVSSQANLQALQKQREKITRYANEYFEKHDANKNGMLDKDELKKMRRPPTNADTNKDERVSKNEFIASQMPKTKSSSTLSSSSSKTNRRISRRDRSSSQASKGSSSGVFGGKDKNGDNVLQMHEYADRWTQKTLDDFDKKDANGDGLLTPAEWLKR